MRSSSWMINDDEVAISHLLLMTRLASYLATTKSQKAKEAQFRNNGKSNGGACRRFCLSHASHALFSCETTSFSIISRAFLFIFFVTDCPIHSIEIYKIYDYFFFYKYHHTTASYYPHHVLPFSSLLMLLGPYLATIASSKTTEAPIVR